MIAWTIEAALESGIFDHVYVATDSEEISQIAQQCGAKVPFLRESDADDHTPISSATLNYANKLQEHFGESIENVTQLMANCPLRTAQDIRGFASAFDHRQSDFLLSSVKFGWMNPWWAFKLDDAGQHEFLFPRALKSRSQDLEELFCPTGSIWMARLNALQQEGTFYGESQMFEEIHWKAAIDIDNWEDLEFAKAFTIPQ